ncbi:MAG: RloB family protein [Spirochaetia bacterium]|nr:RloB family protein [Spirochaetia bacterium]MDY5818098.1 RloB family protein [Treponema sp.]
MREDRTFGNRTKIRLSDEVNRKCFFFCEGQETEPIYFAKLKELKNEIGISPLIDFIQIEKTRGEDWSNPKKMLDALCLDLSKEITYNTLINAMIDCLYTSDYLVKHRDKIKEFSDLLVSFMHEELNVAETDIVKDVHHTTKAVYDFFNQQRPRICNIIMSNVTDILNNYEITFDKEIDYLCLVVDRDPESFTEFQFDDVLKTCKQNNFEFLISNPDFELWLLLHFDDIHDLDNEKLLKNEKINPGSKSSIRFIPNELRKCLGTYKKSRYDVTLLIKNIDKAIKNEKNYCESLPELKNELGSNIGVFIEKLRQIN